MSDVRQEGENRGSGSLLQDFAALWEQSPNPPDIASFLSSNHCDNSSAFADLVQFDQTARAKVGRLIPVEDYFAIELDCQLNDASKVDLIAADHNCRLGSGDESTVNDYLQRFPTLADRISEALSGDTHDPIADQTAVFISGQSGELKASDEADFSVDGSLKEDDSPTFIGRYRIVHSLGRGSFGQVFLAHDTELDRSVAIKIAHKHRIRSEEDTEAYLKEARMLASLDHPSMHIAVTITPRWVTLCGSAMGDGFNVCCWYETTSGWR